MKSLLAVILLASAPLSAQDGPQSNFSHPEQFPGQLSRLRLDLLYPKLVSETRHDYGADPDGRLEGFLADSAPVLKNAKGLIAYLHEGLKHPGAVEGSRKWTAAWDRLDEEVRRLQPIVAEGETLLDGPMPAPKPAASAPPDKPEFDSPDGLRLHRATALAARGENLRELLTRGTRQTAAALRDEDRALAPAFARW